MYKFYMYIDGIIDGVRDYGYCTKRHMMRVANNLIRYCDKVEVRDEFNRVIYSIKF